MMSKPRSFVPAPKRLAAAAAFLAALTGPVPPALAQEPDAGRVQMTRDQLATILEELEAAANSGAYSGSARSRAAEEARLIRQRLEDGDFQTGDRVVLAVRNEPALTDTFTVTGDQSLPLPLGGSVPLAGVLRSELAETIRAHLAQFIRDPEVRAESLMRVTVAGQITSPGFYTVRAEALVGDVLMTAGGPTREADVTGLYIEREGRKIWEGPGLEEAIAQGRTLDQLSIRAGDRLMVPEQERSEGIGRTLLFAIPPLASLVLAIFSLR